MRLAYCRLAAVLPILAFSVLALAQGTTPSHTLLLPAGGSAGQSSFSVNVRAQAGIGPPFPNPTGTVTLYNGATSIGSPGMLTAGSGFTNATFAAIFGTPDPSLAAAASGAVWGDFNEDRAPDLLVYGPPNGSNGQSQEIQVFLAKLDNPLAFPQPPSYTPVAAQQLALPLQTQYGQSLAVLDVDGDGHLDLLAGNTVAYGKGDGTFGRVAVLPALASGYSQTYAVDIDGDGKTDIVAVDTPPAVSAPGTVQYAFTVFHNGGSGSFTAMGPYPLAPSFAAGSSVFYNIFGLSFADVNGDGRMDVLSQSNAVPLGNAAEPAALNIMLNLGSGFSAPKPIDTSAIPYEGMVSTAFAGLIFVDLNDDTKQDLVFSYQANTMNNGVAVLLGNGDGTFGPPTNYTIGSTLAIGNALLPLITEDISGDGNTDVILGNGVLLLGSSDGTLTAGTPLFTSTVAPGNPPAAYAVLTGPVIGTERGGQVIFVNLQSDANAVFIPNLGSDAALTAAPAPGTYSLTAHYSGDATYGALRLPTRHPARVLSATDADSPELQRPVRRRDGCRRRDPRQGRGPPDPQSRRNRLPGRVRVLRGLRRRCRQLRPDGHQPRTAVGVRERPEPALAGRPTDCGDTRHTTRADHQRRRPDHRDADPLLLGWRPCHCPRAVRRHVLPHGR